MAEAWEPWVAAAFAPVAIWVLWRAQILSVELLRWRLVKLTRWGGTRWLYNIVSWFGTFLHEVSHATVLILSGHGIREFRAGVEQGHVLPARMRRGPVAFLSFLVAALAPLFIPPMLVLLGLVLLADNPLSWDPGASGLRAAMDVLVAEFVRFPIALARAIAGLDLARWAHLAVFVLLLLAMPASRPSHVKGSRFHGTQDEGDVPVLRRRIREQPLIFILFLALLYGAYFLMLVIPSRFYWYPIEAVWAVALTGIVLSLLGAVWWTLTGLAGQTKALLAWLGPAAFVATQVLFRLPGPPAGPEALMLVNGVSLAAWLVVAGTAALLVPRRRGLV